MWGNLARRHSPLTHGSSAAPLGCSDEICIVFTFRTGVNVPEESCVHPVSLS
jgi:hypothetical protein